MDVFFRIMTDDTNFDAQKATEKISIVIQQVFGNATQSAQIQPINIVDLQQSKHMLTQLLKDTDFSHPSPQFTLTPVVVDRKVVNFTYFDQQIASDDQLVKTILES